MIEQQIADLKKYYSSLNLPQKLSFIDKLKAKIENETDARVINQLRRLRNECVSIYNSEALRKKTQENQIRNKVK